jgi:hypothetical protein
MTIEGATTPTEGSELATVELEAEAADWPAGTVGTLVETFAHEGFVEIVDDAGRTRAIVTAAYEALRVHEAAG